MCLCCSGSQLSPAQTSSQTTSVYIMQSFLLLSLLSLLSARVSAGPGCGPCDPDQCASLPAEGCPAGSLLDSCGCCSVCAAAEGELCGGRRAEARRCGPGLECVKTDADKKNKMGLCACKSDYEVCGTDGVTYRNGCALKSASVTAEREGREPISVQNKGRCATGELVKEVKGQAASACGAGECIADVRSALTLTLETSPGPNRSS